MDTEILILDGGLGTTLEDQHNVKFSTKTPLWSSQLLITDPETLKKVQNDFARSADIILTPTYQASHVGFARSGVPHDKVAEYFHSATRISRDTGRIVAMSLGAYGAVLQPSQEYSGLYDTDEAGLKRFHAERLAVCEEYDLLAFETLPRLDEVRAVKAVANGKYWITCVFPNENRLPDGTSIPVLLKTMMAYPVPWGIGMNCTKVAKIAGLITEFEEAAEEMNITLPRLVIYPDGTNGLKYDTTLQQWVGSEEDGPAWDEQVATIVSMVQRRGKWKGIVVGGCCKTTPEHIARLRARLKSDLHRSMSSRTVNGR